MGNNAQGAIEYLLIIAAAILVVAIVILAITGALGGGQDQSSISIDKQCSSFQGLQYAQNKEEYASIQNGLLGYWNLNGDTLDISGNNQNGFDCTGHCPSVVDGLWGSKAYAFDGMNSYLDFGSFFPAEEMKTITFWANFNSDNTSPGQEIVSKSTNSRGVEVLWYNGGLAYYVMGGYSRTIVKPKTEINLGEWYFVVATQENGDMKFYIDNELVGSNNDPPTPLNGLDDKLLFGDWAVGGSRRYNGALEEVGIWNRVISSAERDFLWNNGKGREVIFCE